MQREIQAVRVRTAAYRRERRSVRRAREFARSALADWDVRRRVEDVVLCVSELATNAVLHGVPPGRGYRLWLALGAEDGVLRVEVHDSGDGEPRVPERGRAADEESGRGLWLVSVLADKWGVEERRPGKIVWCEWWPVSTEKFVTA
ncbi:ATP-binding protein [Streptomyces gilvosporeus]|uniref:ATP-binding protein n=1 Tax=Streptomyces gilvosporeus TaxID=553510 RepID=A0A1V0TXM3_9ACTN|nr:ATP-binding protein [Streptomyces gilvosporeus]ARF57550.1 ATP-binding protein [Streptomyces gilvosporeus]